MKIYLAARYSRREELLRYAEQLEALGHEVTSRWLNGSHQINDAGAPIGDDGEAMIEGDAGGDSPEAAELRRRFAQEDIEDLFAAHMVICFTEPPRSTASRGGRHVELGLALTSCTLTSTIPSFRLLVVGHRENLFCWLPQVEFYRTWEEALEALKIAD